MSKPSEKLDSVADAPAPLSPEQLKEKLYSALVEQHLYTRSKQSKVLGYYESVEKDGIEISGVVSSGQMLRVDVSVFVKVVRSRHFGETTFTIGGVNVLALKELIYVNEDNLTEVLEKLGNITGEAEKLVREDRFFSSLIKFFADYNPNLKKLEERL